MITAEDLVRREVHYCISALVSTLAQGYGAFGNGAAAYEPGAKAASDIENLCQQAAELAAPVDDWEEAALEHGADFWQHELGAWYCYHPSMEIEGPNLSPYGPHDSCEESARHYCEDLSVEPYQREVFEHWIVSDWLADKLEAHGEKVDKDFAGMTVWARTTTGQGIASDSVIEKIAADINRAEPRVLERGTQVRDRDGFEGGIVHVSHQDGRVWYDVRFPSGVAVRYPEDLTVIESRG